MMNKEELQFNLPSERKEFEEFPGFYEEEIAPYLRSLEKERRESVVNAGILVGSLTLLTAAILFYGPFGQQNLFLGGLLGFGSVGMGTYLIDKTRSKVNDGLMSRICKKMNFGYRNTFSRPDYCEEFKNLKLLPTFNREHWEDEISGSYQNTPFKLCEAHLKYKSSGKNSSTRTVFHGQILKIKYPKKFFGKTIIKRDHGVMNRLNKPGKEYSNVGLGSPIFEKAFEAWSTDQVEARDLLDPIVLERFQELDRLYKGAQLRAAFADGELLVVIETGDSLNMGSMFQTLEKPDRLEMILKEFDLIFDLIDVAVARVGSITEGEFSVQNVRNAS